jgi:hypothetical protein
MSTQQEESRMPVTFRNPVSGARLVIDTREGVERIERGLGGMWQREERK